LTSNDQDAASDGTSSKTPASWLISQLAGVFNRSNPVFCLYTSSFGGAKYPIKIGP
jgi:hypothetical protein